MINYITNLDINNFSGGWSGMNHHVHDQLSKQHEINLIQNINPPYSLSEKIQSKAARIVGLKGSYPAFSSRRLDQIANMVHAKLHAGKLNFFHGATSWLHVKNKIPYAMYLDATFYSYMHVYHKANNFKTNQLKELYLKEAQFLQNAAAVFFSSEWAMQDAIMNYKIDSNHLQVAGLGGGYEDISPENETRQKYFLFVGLDFNGKGGNSVVRAFQEVKKKHPTLQLKIVGEKPPEIFNDVEGLVYEGFINKTDPSGAKKLKNLFQQAYAFVLPTAKDMTPLVVIEAASVKCPVIATKVFGIPEMIIDGQTGYLIDSKKNLVTQLVSSMEELLRDEQKRNEFGENAYRLVNEKFSWAKTGEVINNYLHKKIEGI